MNSFRNFVALKGDDVCVCRLSVLSGLKQYGLHQFEERVAQTFQTKR